MSQNMPSDALCADLRAHQPRSGAGVSPATGRALGRGAAVFVYQPQTNSWWSPDTGEIVLDEDMPGEPLLIEGPSE